jgi:hypothetical protein
VTTPGLDGVTLRLQRADELLLRLGAKRNDFLAAKGRELIGSFEPETQEFVVRVSGPLPPPEWGILVSEFLHHLRAALDILLVALVIRRGGSTHRRTQFVICKTPKQWRKATNGKNDALSGVDAGDRDLIATLQPAFGGVAEHRNWLAVLSDMCDLDRHFGAGPRFLALPADAGAGLQLTPQNETTGSPEPAKPQAGLDGGDRAEVYRAFLPDPGPHPELRFKQEPEIDVTFGFSGAPVLYGDLVSIRHEVQLILRLFEPELVGAPRSAAGAR